jgi:hypothetical protein
VFDIPHPAFTIYGKGVNNMADKDHPRFTNQHGYYREVFTKLLAVNPAKAEEIQVMQITSFDKIVLIEKELG